MQAQFSTASQSCYRTLQKQFRVN